MENQPLERAGTRVSIRHPDRWIALLVALVAFALALTMTRTAPGSWNDISRVAAIQARVEQGTWTLDNSPWLNETEDIVFLNDQFFSGKMPLLSGIGALLYAGLHSATGLSLAPDCAESGVGCAYYWLTLSLVGFPFALMLGLVYLWARSLNFSIPLALLGAVALGLGTQTFPYSLVLNHHVPAAAALFVGLYSLTVLAPRSVRWLLLTGFAAAFAALCDPLAGAFGVGLFGVAVYRYRRGAVYFILGALPPVLVTLWLDLQITGTILPPYVIPQAYMDRQAGAERGLAGAGTPDDLPQYAFKMYLGAQGLFAYNPILLFALLGIVIVAFTRRAALRPEAIAVGLSALVMGVYLALRTGNLGGEGYGERYFISMVPVVMAFLWFAPPLFKTRARALFALLFAVALGLSLFSSYQGAHRPWDYVQPPFQLTRDSKTGAIGAKWNVR